MRNRLPHGLGGRGHWVDMLGVDLGKVNRLPLPPSHFLALRETYEGRWQQLPVIQKVGVIVALGSWCLFIAVLVWDEGTTPGTPGRQALALIDPAPCASMSTQKARKDGAPAEISLNSAFLSVSYAYGNAIGIRVAGFRIPASLSAEPERGSMIETIVNLRGRPTLYIVGAGQRVRKSVGGQARALRVDIKRGFCGPVA